jgi:hypothetical protein
VKAIFISARITATKPDLIEDYACLLMGRGAAGLTIVDAARLHKLPLPVVARTDRDHLTIDPILQVIIAANHDQT